jgi:hypothetical protein
MDADSFSRSACFRLALVGISAFESIRIGFPCSLCRKVPRVKEDTKNSVVAEDVSVVVCVT